MTSTDEDVIEEAYQECLKQAFKAIAEFSTVKEGIAFFEKRLTEIRAARSLALVIIRENPKTAIRDVRTTQIIPATQHYEING
jgi:hypothetical protein